jgi:hypothetical protein
VHEENKKSQNFKNIRRFLILGVNQNGRSIHQATMLYNNILHHVNIHLYHRITMLIQIFSTRFSIKKCLTLNVCPTAAWQTNATTVVGEELDTGIIHYMLLSFPTDVYVDNNSTIYVLDAGNYRVVSFDSDSTVGTTIIESSGGDGLDQFYWSEYNDL